MNQVFKVFSALLGLSSFNAMASIVLTDGISCIQHLDLSDTSCSSSRSYSGGEDDGNPSYETTSYCELHYSYRSKSGEFAMDTLIGEGQDETDSGGILINGLTFGYSGDLFSNFNSAESKARKNLKEQYNELTLLPKCN